MSQNKTLNFVASDFVGLPNSTPCNVVVEGVVSMTPEDDRLSRDHAHMAHKAGELNGALRLVVLLENRTTMLLHNQHLGGCKLKKRQNVVYALQNKSPFK